MSTTRKRVDGERDSAVVLGDDLHTMSDQNTHKLGGGGVHPLTPNISAESSGRFQACLLVVLNLPYRFGKDRFARDPKPFDGRTDGGANDLGIALVVMMADQVAHTGHIGPRHIRVAPVSYTHLR